MSHLHRRHAARNLADAVGGIDWRGWPGPSQAAWQKLEAQTLWGRTGRLKERQACQRSMADLRESRGGNQSVAQSQLN